jgi:saposin-like type B protein
LSTSTDDEGTPGEMKELLPAMKVNKSTTKCTICNLVSTELEQYLEDPSTEKSIETFLDSICAKLPKNFNQECQSFVQDYGEQFIELVGEELDPKEVGK